MIRLESLRSFVTVARSGTLRAAAGRLGRTQSALSMTLKQLEADLGGPLFESDRKRDLTDLGRYVLGVAEGLIEDHDRALARIAAYAAGQSGRLRLVSVPSVAALLLPDLLRGFIAAHGTVEIDLMDTDSRAVRQAVASGRADLGLASPGAADQGLGVLPLFADPLYLICRADSGPGRGLGPLHWAELEPAGPLILNETLPDLDDPDFRRLAGQSRLSVRNTLSLLAMVEAGMGVTVLPGLATLGLPRALVARPLADPACTRQVALLWRRDRTPSPLARALRDHLAAGLPALAARHTAPPG